MGNVGEIRLRIVPKKEKAKYTCARSSDATGEEALKLCRVSLVWKIVREGGRGAFYSLPIFLHDQNINTENLATKAITWRPKNLKVIRYK